MYIMSHGQNVQWTKKIIINTYDLMQWDSDLLMKKSIILTSNILLRRPCLIPSHIFLPHCLYVNYYFNGKKDSQCKNDTKYIQKPRIKYATHEKINFTTYCQKD